MTDAQGGKWRYVYDRLGHLTETHDPGGRVEQTQWHPVRHQPETEVWMPRGRRGVMSMMSGQPAGGQHCRTSARYTV